jgi:very-short-patch-repair endonuclease
VNVAARDSTGRFLALPDLSYPDLTIAIEYDGDIHRADKATWRRDIRRRQALEAAGWRVVTCTADDVLRNPERLVAWVRAAIRARSRV